MTSAGAPCPVERNGIDVPEDERLYGELRFVFHCPAGAPVTLDYRVFFDVDPGHVGMLEVESPGGKTRAELIRERPRWEVQHHRGRSAAAALRRQHDSVSCTETCPHQQRQADRYRAGDGRRKSRTSGARRGAGGASRFERRRATESSTLTVRWLVAVVGVVVLAVASLGDTSGAAPTR